MNLSKYSVKGMFVLESLVSDEIVAGQTGVLLSAPEVSGKVYKITLLTAAASPEQSGMSLVVDGVTVFNETILMDITPTSPTVQVQGDGFGVSHLYSATNLASGARILREIYCTSFSLIKNTGNTTEGIDYVYQVGSFK